MNMKYKIGLVLSGGGARGFAHLGVIKALKEKGIEPDIISGVSAGAIAGVLIADGFSADQAFKIMKEENLFGYYKVRMPRQGFLSLEKLKTKLNKHLSVKKLEDLAKPLFVAITNLYAGEIEYHNQGNIPQLILASASIPVIFNPIKINSKLYVDGGIFDNLPVKPLLGKCKKIIGVNIDPVPQMKKIDNLLQIAKRTFHLSIKSTINKSLEHCDLLIEPPELSEFDILDASKAKKMFDIGYNYTKNLKD